MKAKRKDRLWEVCSVLFISKEFESESEYVAVGFERLSHPLYSSFVIGVRARKARLADTDGDNAVLRVFDNPQRRCDGDEFYHVFGEIFSNRTANV